MKNWTTERKRKVNELLDIILDDLNKELEYAEARNDHRAVDLLRMVIDRIEAREYEHCAMIEGRYPNE